MKKQKMKRVAHCVTISRRLLDDFKGKYKLPVTGGRLTGKYYSLNQLIELAISEVLFTPGVNTLKYNSMMSYICDRKIKHGITLYDEKIKITVRLNPGFNTKCQNFIDMNEWRGFSHMVQLAMINARGVE